MSKSFDYRQVGRRVLETELTALRGLQEYIDEQFNQACELMLHCTGKVIVMGMGKSGHIARWPPPSPAPARPPSLSIQAKPAMAIWEWSPHRMW